MKKWLLSLNKNWIAATGASLAGIGVAYNVAHIEDALASVIGSIHTKPITGIVNLLSAIGVGMAYLGRPGTVSDTPKKQP